MQRGYFFGIIFLVLSLAGSSLFFSDSFADHEGTYVDHPLIEEVKWVSDSLVITDGYLGEVLDPDTLVVFQSVYIGGEVTNLGNDWIMGFCWTAITKDLTTAIYEKNPAVHCFGNNIAPNETKIIGFNPASLKVGHYNTQIILDPTDELVEINEHDNMISVTYTVSHTPADLVAYVSIDSKNILSTLDAKQGDQIPVSIHYQNNGPGSGYSFGGTIPKDVTLEITIETVGLPISAFFTYTVPSECTDNTVYGDDSISMDCFIGELNGGPAYQIPITLSITEPIPEWTTSIAVSASIQSDTHPDPDQLNNFDITRIDINGIPQTITPPPQPIPNSKTTDMYVTSTYRDASFQNPKEQHFIFLLELGNNMDDGNYPDNGGPNSYLKITATNGLKSHPTNLGQSGCSISGNTIECKSVTSQYSNLRQIAFIGTQLGLQTVDMYISDTREFYTDVNLANNHYSKSVLVTQIPSDDTPPTSSSTSTDLSISVSPISDTSSVNPGDLVMLKYTITNKGPANVQSPNNVNLIWSDSAAEFYTATCNNYSLRVTEHRCDIGDLAVGASTDVVITWRVLENTLNGSGFYLNAVLNSDSVRRLNIDDDGAKYLVTISTSTPAPTPQSCDISSEDSGIITVSGYDFNYSIIAGKIMSMTIDQTINSLVVQITSCEKGKISLDLPRNLIDSKNQDGSDDKFIILIDGREVKYSEFSGFTDSRPIEINFEKGASDIEIIGTVILQSTTTPPTIPNNASCKSVGSATVELNEKVYTWTDKIHVTIISPCDNNNSNAIETIGSSGEIRIATSGHNLINPQLIETGTNTGIFVGTITLTGFAHDADGDGTNDTNPRTLVSGSNHHLESEGSISYGSAYEDGIVVAYDFTDDVSVLASALIHWNIGDIYWVEESYHATSTGVVRVIDPDMNLNPEIIDTFKIDVWSDADAKGIDLTVTETNEETGIFEGTVFFTTTDESHIHLLRVAEGDTVTAKYEDNTLPKPYTTADELDINAESKIQGTTQPPPTIPKVTIISLQPTDQQGNNVSSFTKGELGFVKVVINSNTSVDSLVTVNLFDSELTSLGIGSVSSTLTSGESSFTLSFFIPSEASIGIGDIYAGVYSDWPSNGGAPLTGESSSTVIIK